MRLRDFARAARRRFPAFTLNIVKMASSARPIHTHFDL
jgi:hypothetical protein